MTCQRIVYGIGAVIVFLSAGCSSGNRSSVSGTVTFDGQPVESGSIAFIPDGGGTGATPASGEIKDGKYALDSERGPMPGKYRVEIIWKKKTGKQIPNQSDPGTTMDETKQVIPQKYNTKTELTAEIKAGSNRDVNYDLKAGGPVDAGISTSSGGRAKAAGD